MSEVLERFLRDRQMLAVRIPCSELGGLFRASVRVPTGTVALLTLPDGSLQRHTSGSLLEGKFELLLVKEGEIVLKLILSDLPSADGYPFQVALTVTASVATRSLDLLRDFASSLFPREGEFTTRNLKEILAPLLRPLVADAVRETAGAELHRRDPAAAWNEPFAARLEREIFGQGLEFRKLSEAACSSAEYAQAREKAEQRAASERRSAETLQKKEDRIRRFVGILQDEQVRDILQSLPDERIRGMIIARLLEDDDVSITAQDLIARAGTCGEEVVQAVFETMQRLLGQGASIGIDEIAPARAEGIFLAAGSRVYEIPPDRSDLLEHEFPESLRSVRFSGRLLGGAKRGVYALAPSGQVLGYPLPGSAAPRGGVNSMAVAGPFLFATHSEFGLARWSLDEPGEPGEILYPEVTRDQKTVRGVEVEGSHLFFASGPHVYGAPSGDGAAPTKYVSSVESPITCLATAARSVFAGTESGTIVGWKLDAPDQPVILVRKRDPIVNLRLARISTIPHLFYSTRDMSVRARVLGQSLETAYDSGGSSVGILDAASDLICASDSAGRRVFLWKATNPGKPIAEIDIWPRAGKPILDLWMRKSPVGAGESP